MRAFVRRTRQKLRYTHKYEIIIVLCNHFTYTEDCEGYIIQKKRQNRANLHQIFDDEPAVHSNKDYYTEVEKTCMALQETMLIT